jgi:hypothetical protein
VTVLASGGLGAGLIGFLVVLALCIAAVFLFRSMSKHLRKVPPTFDKDDDHKVE